MTKTTIRKTIIGTTSVLAFLIIVLCVHIYIVTRPKPLDMNTIVMARIDLKQPITQGDAEKIKEWMYQQKGVAHVVVNTQMDNIVFTYHAIMTDGNYVANNFRNMMHFPNATRYVPTEAEMQSGCPVAATSMTYKVYHFIRHTF